MHYLLKGTFWRVKKSLHSSSALLKKLPLRLFSQVIISVVLTI